MAGGDGEAERLLSDGVGEMGAGGLERVDGLGDCGIAERADSRTEILSLLALPSAFDAARAAVALARRD